MTLSRATAYVGLASVLVAWLAGATGLTVSSNPPGQAPRPTATSGTQAIADQVQAQAVRLRGRLAAAPAPRDPARNPFTFAPAVSTPRGAPAAAPAVRQPGAERPPEPPLQLIGVAERHTAGSVVRTAMVTADSDELFMLAEGDTLGARYRVKSVGADLVELTDLVTGASRKLTLR